MDYFTLFNLPKKYRINKSLLSEAFYKLQLKFHPDLFIHCSEFEKKIVLQKSIEINKGYKILQDSLKRGIYLLSLNGFKISKEKFLCEDKDFLKKYFFLYEELDFLTENNCDEVQIEIFFKKIKNIIKNYEKTIEIKFDEKKWNDVIRLITELLFFKKIQTRLKKQ
ncbi:Fe-S protein assembly co-chaperone HscB [Buchnera aphidicola]|uniref:Co-chaperone protein HscB n=1 Tax=Buchnera aphidicola subsp. Rhopalosiphum maidis TaxID=118109 RepID=A0A3G2I5Z1_BUCRM|nr:Fe-S protein assembly co-chaperone HscB [Buchnera aphidicola]AYN24503.1 Fe-S protein assembly co-chaperone HscB [Buchnera aphidicola (Rhopalosiphum maidis)]